MSIEAKTTMLRRIETALADKLTARELSGVMSAVSDVLPAFEVEQSSQEGGTDDLLEAFLSAKAIEGRSEKTLERYRYQIRRLMDAVSVPTQEITVYHIRRYLAAEKACGIADRTLEGVRQIYAGYFNWLQREGLIRGNPAGNLGTIKVEKKVVETLSDVEMEMLRGACRDIRERALLAFLAATGCRVSELCGLDRDSINLRDRVCKVHGKGNKERMVYFDGVTAMLLGRYMMTRTDENPALFVTERDHERIKPGGVRWILNELGARSGVEHVHPHRLRRTCATKLVSRGMTLQNVARVLGHDKIETTMRYVRIDDGDVRAAYNMCV